MTKDLEGNRHPKWHQDVLNCDYPFLDKYFSFSSITEFALISSSLQISSVSSAVGWLRSEVSRHLGSSLSMKSP